MEEDADGIRNAIVEHIVTMEEVVCSCSNCDSELGCFKNSWNGIGSTYYSPVYAPVNYVNGFDVTGDVYQAPPGSLVQNSHLQDLACRKCQTVIGMVCDNAPEGHMLRKNQLILRLAHMSVISSLTGSRASISIQERFALTLPGAKKIATIRRASTVQPSGRSATPSFPHSRRSINGIMPPPPIPEKSQRGLDTFGSWAQEAISQQEKDIARIGSAVDRIEHGMRSFQDFMEEVRTELATHSRETVTQGDIASVRDDLGGLRDQLGSYQKNQKSKQQNMDALTEELIREVHVLSVPEVSRDHFNVLVEDVQRVDRKANEIVRLNEELESLKRRLRSFGITLSSASQIQGSYESTISIPGEQNLPRPAGTFIENGDLPLAALNDPNQQIANEGLPSVRPSTRRSFRENLDAGVTASGGRRISNSIIRDSEEIMERSIDHQEKPHVLPKRKRYPPEKILEISDPPAKRTRLSTRKSFDATSIRNGLITPTICIDRDSSPILGRYNENGELDLSQGEESFHREETIPAPVLKNPVISELQQGRGRQRTVSLGHAAGGPVRPERRRTVSLSMLPTSVDPGTAGGAFHRIENHHLDLRNPKQQRSNGPFPANADRRSLRPKRKSSNKENETPSQSSKPTEPNTLTQTEHAPVVPTNDAILPSIESDTFEVVIPLVQSPPANSRRQFDCAGCGRRYKFAHTLEKHKLLSGCAESQSDEAAVREMEEGRKRKMEERDRLVKQALEREL